MSLSFLPVFYGEQPIIKDDLGLSLCEDTILGHSSV